MNLSSKTVSTLNPNATEFVPTGLRCGPTFPNIQGSNIAVIKNSSKNAVLDRTNSVNSSASDDERQQYWQAQLPDDITPDFDFMSQAADDRVLRRHQGFGQENSSDVPDLSSNLDMQVMGAENVTGFLSDSVGEHTFSIEMRDIDPIDLLASEFPGFAAESLADIFSANGGDLSLTIEMLTELELQEDAFPAHMSQSQTSFSNLSMRDFPALAGTEIANSSSQLDRDIDVQQAAKAQGKTGMESLFTSRSFVSGDSRAVTDFAAVVRKNTAIQLQHDRGVEYDFGSSRTYSQNLEGDAGDYRAPNVDKLERYSSRSHSQSAPPVWLETGEAVSNIYTQLREEASDHARVRNAYFEQARQAYLIGNKALAKDLSAKGQWHNGLMKNAHNKTGESIFQLRNLSSGQIQGLCQGQSQLLDLHGLHVNEAIPVLKRELAALKLVVRSTQQKQLVFICVGTGHHTKGSRTPARLPVAVEKYLAEEEHLHFTEQQPGMLRVVLG